MKTKFLFYAIMIVVLIAGCSSPQATTTEVPLSTTASTKAPPSTTNITIDGDPSDWERYPVSVADSVGDSIGNVDVKSIRTFTNDRFLYLLVEVEGEIGSYVQLDVDFNPGSDGWPDYMANAYPNNQDFVPHVARIENQQFNHLQNTTGEVAQGEAFELRFPLDLFGDSQITMIRVRVMDGECCESNWLTVDETEPTQIARINETDVSAVVSAPTLVPTLEPPKETKITIDGNATDWDSYRVVGVDPTGDAQEGTPDVTNVYAILNDQFVYVLIELAEPGITGKFDLGFETSGENPPDYFVTVWPHERRNVFAVGIGGGASPNDSITTAQGEAVEVRFPLTLLENNKILSFNVQIDLGGSVGDSFYEVRPRVEDELEPAPPAYAVPAPSNTLSFSGQLTLDTTWSGEIHITGDITLSTGVILTIEPGTTVYLASNSDDTHRGQATSDSYIDSHNDPVGTAEWDQNAITIDGRGGTINAIGTAEKPIVFRPEGESTSSGQWDGIYIEKGTIQYAKVLYAGRTAIQILSQKNDGSPKEQVEIAYNEVRFYHWAGIDSHTYNVWIHHNVVEGGGHQAMSVGSQSIAEYNFLSHCQNAMFIGGVDVIVRNNIVVDCARGLQISNPRIPTGSEISITNNTVVQTQGPPDGWYYQGKLIYPAHAESWAISNQVPNLKLNIQNNIVSGPFMYGINLIAAPGSGSVVDYNLFWGVGQNFNGNSVGSHNLFSDPMFTDIANGDFHLLAGSPAIDVGIPELLDADGSLSDLGAYGGPEGDDW